MFTQQLELLPSEFSPFLAVNKDCANNLPEFLKEKYINLGKNAQHSFAQLSMKDWLSFSRTGNRQTYESVLFAKRRQLSDLTLAEFIQSNNTFTDDILNGIYSITGEFAWWLPAHNSYIRDTPQLTYPNTNRPVLELFSAETGALLATVCQIMGEKLPKEAVEHVNNALQQRIFAPYCNEHFWWMGNGDEEMCNWTPWCTQNVLLAAFCTNQPYALRKKIVEKACYSLDCFLQSYAEDGGCSEGAQYYHHAALTLFGCMEILSTVAPNAFSCLFNQPKIYNMAAFILNMHISDIYYINFADCSAIAGRRGAREYLFAKRTSNKAMEQFVCEDFAKAINEQPENHDIARINLWYSLLEVENAQNMLKEPKQPYSVPDVYYAGTGIFVARDNTYCLGAKAGNNADSHNHNDTGSFIIYKNGNPFFIDIGVETYTKKTFSPERYSIWTMQSAWHNLPTFNGIMQNEGKSFCATNVKTSFTTKKAEISMNIATAYPENAKVKEYNRTIALIKNSEIIINDTTTYEGEPVLTLLTIQCPKAANETTLNIGNLGTLELENAKEIKITKVPITDSRLLLALPESIYAIHVKFSKNLKLIIK